MEPSEIIRGNVLVEGAAEGGGEGGREGQQEGSLSTKNDLCHICLKIPFKYKCPQCSIRYCSLQCYRNSSHSSVCLESDRNGFYKREVMHEMTLASAEIGGAGNQRGLKGGGGNRKDILAILKRQHNLEINDFDAFTMNNGPDQNYESEEDEGSYEEGEESLELDERFVNINNESMEDILRKLTPKEFEEWQKVSKNLDYIQDILKSVDLKADDDEVADDLEHAKEVDSLPDKPVQEQIPWNPWWLPNNTINSGTSQIKLRLEEKCEKDIIIAGTAGKERIMPGKLLIEEVDSPTATSSAGSDPFFTTAPPSSVQKKPRGKVIHKDLPYTFLDFLFAYVCTCRQLRLSSLAHVRRENNALSHEEVQDCLEGFSPTLSLTPSPLVYVAGVTEVLVTCLENIDTFHNETATSQLGELDVISDLLHLLNYKTSAEVGVEGIVRSLQEMRDLFLLPPSSSKGKSEGRSKKRNLELSKKCSFFLSFISSPSSAKENVDLDEGLKGMLDTFGRFRISVALFWEGMVLKREEMGSDGDGDGDLTVVKKKKEYGTESVEVKDEKNLLIKEM